MGRGGQQLEAVTSAKSLLYGRIQRGSGPQPDETTLWNDYIKAVANTVVETGLAIDRGPEPSGLFRLENGLGRMAIVITWPDRFLKVIPCRENGEFGLGIYFTDDRYREDWDDDNRIHLNGSGAKYPVNQREAEAMINPYLADLNVSYIDLKLPDDDLIGRVQAYGRDIDLTSDLWMTRTDDKEKERRLCDIADKAYDLEAISEDDRDRLVDKSKKLSTSDNYLEALLQDSCGVDVLKVNDNQAVRLRI